MWMGELASRTGLSVATIKFYLREGLLHGGEAVGATRARYDESHVRRLRLIRALTDVAGLKLETVRRVLADIESAPDWHLAVGSAHTRLSPTPAEPATEQSVERVDRMVERNGWSLHPANPQRAVLARALDALAALEHPVDEDLLDVYADAMAEVAAAEIDRLPGDDPESAAEHAVLGTLLLEPVLLSVRRIAQQNAARARAASRL